MQGVSSIRLPNDPKRIGAQIIQLSDFTVATFPLYRYSYVPPLHCARHSRLAANEFFGRHYDKPAAAWNLKYIYETIPVTDLYQQIRSGVLQPGDLIGMYNPESLVKDEADETG